MEPAFNGYPHQWLPDLAPVTIGLKFCLDTLIQLYRLYSSNSVHQETCIFNVTIIKRVNHNRTMKDLSLQVMFLDVYSIIIQFKE